MGKNVPERSHYIIDLSLAQFFQVCFLVIGCAVHLGTGEFQKTNVVKSLNKEF